MGGHCFDAERAPSCQTLTPPWCITGRTPQARRRHHAAPSDTLLLSLSQLRDLETRRRPRPGRLRAPRTGRVLLHYVACPWTAPSTSPFPERGIRTNGRIATEAACEGNYNPREETVSVLCSRSRSCVSGCLTGRSGLQGLRRSTLVPARASLAARPLPSLPHSLCSSADIPYISE